MHCLFTTVLLILAVQWSVAPPVTQNKNDEEHKNNENEIEVEDVDESGNGPEYHRYLKEIIQVLEDDPGFREKLEKADENDIRTGKIAHELQFVNHQVRTQLDEIKRNEIKRLNDLIGKEQNLKNGIDLEHLKITEHLDHSNNYTFEIIDLQKLIKKTTQDLAEADKKRREEFKQYEMQKKFEEEQKINAMNAEQKKKYEAELEEQKKKLQNHESLHHPGSKQQLEEVWEKEDHMDPEDFNPKTFFMMHDVDGNGVWDETEVKALFLKELDKLYSSNLSNGDLKERAEEMERMREHVFSEADLNKDNVISYDEFLKQTKQPDFNQDQGWETLDQQQIYSPQDYEAFARQRQEEMERMIAKGIPPAHYPDNGDRQFPPQYADSVHNMQNQMVYQQQPIQGQQQYHDDGVRPQYMPAGQMPIQQQQYHPGQVPNQPQHYPNQASHNSQNLGQQPQHPPQYPQQPIPVAHIPPQHQPNPSVDNRQQQNPHAQLNAQQQPHLNIQNANKQPIAQEHELPKQNIQPGAAQPQQHNDQIPVQQIKQNVVPHVVKV